MKTKVLIPLFIRYSNLLNDADESLFPTTEKCNKSHLMHLCDIAVAGIEDETLAYGKLCRWLGFIQGILCASGVTTVESERNFTRPIFKDKE